MKAFSEANSGCLSPGVSLKTMRFQPATWPLVFWWQQIPYLCQKKCPDLSKCFNCSSCQSVKSHQWVTECVSVFALCKSKAILMSYLLFFQTSIAPSSGCNRCLHNKIYSNDITKTSECQTQGPFFSPAPGRHLLPDLWLPRQSGTDQSSGWRPTSAWQSWPRPGYSHTSRQRPVSR